MMSLDLSKRYAVANHPGIAFRVDDYVTIPLAWDEEPCACGDPLCGKDTSRVVAVMVGDDRERIIDVDDLTPLDDDDYCPGCGQIGCACYGSSE